jgi:hypothetical protein
VASVAKTTASNVTSRRPQVDANPPLALPFTVVQDVHQVVARLYGVRCWPTTVTIGPDARVEHVQFGVPPSREPDASQFDADQAVT